jgi:hypothetical protein
MVSKQYKYMIRNIIQNIAPGPHTMNEPLRNPISGLEVPEYFAQIHEACFWTPISFSKSCSSINIIKLAYPDPRPVMPAFYFKKSGKHFDWIITGI